MNNIDDLQSMLAQVLELPHLKEDCLDGLPCVCGRDKIISGLERYLNIQISEMLSKIEDQYSE